MNVITIWKDIEFEKMKNFLRTLYIFLIGFYFFTLIDHFAYLKFSTLLLLKWFVMVSLWNAGVFLISLDFFIKRKILGTLLFIPSLLTSPLLLPLEYDFLHWGCLVGMILILLKYLKEVHMKFWPPALKKEAKKEVYKFIDKYLRKLSKNQDGTINEFADGFDGNDVDALRHAYTSGVFTQEYGENAADIFGRLNEYFPGENISSSSAENSVNMDLWNNSIGRKYGKKTKSRKDLFKRLMKALKNGELIIDPENDKREYKGAGKLQKNISGMVIVLNENKNGKNRIFYDLEKEQVMKKNEFVTLIKNGVYPNYELRNIHGDEIPASKKDLFSANNLG